MQVSKRLKAAFRGSWLFRATHRRRVHLYGVGTPKSGTHSIAAMFNGTLRAAHEPERRLLNDLAIRMAQGKTGPDEAAKILRRRDRRLWLEVDSSAANVHVLEILVKEFPESRYVMTLRDVYSWLDSAMNHRIARKGPRWVLYDDFFAPPRVYPREERVLEEHGLAPLDFYLSRWVDRNTKILETVPAERLLVVRTHEISRDAERIASFAGLKPGEVDKGKSHAYRAAEKHDLLRKLDRGYLEERVAAHCRTLMQEYFPEVASFEAAPLLSDAAPNGRAQP